jgi:glycosyltransferase involved in cell wall biosynthesis
MKIAVWHNLPSGGGARAMQMHIDGLLSRGHSIEIWSPNPTAGGFLRFPSSVICHEVLLKKKDTMTFSEQVSSFFVLEDENLKAMKAHALQCAQEINTGNFDVVFLNSCFYYAAPLIASYLQKPTVVYLGEPFRPFYEAQPNLLWQAPDFQEISWFRRSYWKSFWYDLYQIRRARVQVREERKAIDAVDELLLNSVFSQESAQRVYNRMGKVCYLGIDTNLFYPSDKFQNPEKPYVIGVGNLVFHKNASFAIRAVSLVDKKHRPTLVWVSNMKEIKLVNTLKEQAQKLDVEFVIKEMIPDEKLRTLLQAASAMVYTSLLEPFGLAPLEANACGTPVVALRQGGVRETIKEGVNGFLCLSEEEMAQKMKLLVRDKVLRQEMGEQSVKEIQQNWTVEAAITRIEEILIKTVEHGTNVR